MENDTPELLTKIQELGDVELAALCCLVAGEHCIIRADAERLSSVADELQEVRSRCILIGKPC
jgi:hypothetical protein